MPVIIEETSDSFIVDFPIPKIRRKTPIKVNIRNSNLGWADNYRDNYVLFEQPQAVNGGQWQIVGGIKLIGKQK